MKVLSDRYSLTRRIAVGGMGEVWAATDMVLHREVAVKILRDDLVDSDVFLERFRAEARHTAALSHPGIARVFDYGEEVRDGLRHAYLVMELVPGEPLSKVMAQQGVFPVNTVLSLLAQVAEALHAAHILGVVHRDVKPGNLLVLDDGTIKVTDFGIARATNAVSITEVGHVIGTARYMSPEQASGSEATAASDVYALGVIGYEMLAGHSLFTAEGAGALAMAHVHQPPPPLPSSIPLPVRDLIAQALSKKPVDRPQDAQAFADGLRRLQIAMMPAPTPALAPDSAPMDQTVVAAIDRTDEPTRQINPLGDGSRTQIMPAAGIVIDTARLLDPPSGRRKQRTRRRLVMTIALSAAVVLAAVGLIANARGRLPAPGPSGPAATEIAIVGATIDPRALIGKTLAQDTAVLKRAGYIVATKTVNVPGVAKDVVVAVQPTGVVAFGATVTLSVSSGAASAVSPTTTTTTTTIAVTTTKPPKKHGKG